MPYWDWASVPTIPDIVNEPTIIITTSAGVQSVSNPLWTYNFHPFPLDPNLFPYSDGPLANYSHTVRQPDSSGGDSDPVAANAALTNPYPSYIPAAAVSHDGIGAK